MTDAALKDRKVDRKIYLRFGVLIWLLLLYLPAYFYDFNFDHSSYLGTDENGFLIYWFSCFAAALLLAFLLFVRRLQFLIFA